MFERLEEPSVAHRPAGMRGAIPLWPIVERERRMSRMQARAVLAAIALLGD